MKCVIYTWCTIRMRKGDLHTLGAVHSAEVAISRRIRTSHFRQILFWKSMPFTGITRTRVEPSQFPITCPSIWYNLIIWLHFLDCILLTQSSQLQEQLNYNNLFGKETEERKVPNPEKKAHNDYSHSIHRKPGPPTDEPDEAYDNHVEDRHQKAPKVVSFNRKAILAVVKLLITLLFLCRNH